MRVRTISNQEDEGRRFESCSERSQTRDEWSIYQIDIYFLKAKGVPEGTLVPGGSGGGTTTEGPGKYRSPF